MKKEGYSTGAKDTTFSEKFTFTRHGVSADLRLPAVMGILNLTPDSFYDGGRFSNSVELLNRVTVMVEEGMDALDIGAYSSRPGADHISEEEELQRLIAPLQKIRSAFPNLLISIDTFRSGVAKEAVQSGADIINDISGGMMDDNMFSTVASLKVPYILMHMQGSPQTMQKDPQYDDVIVDVKHFFEKQLKKLKEAGVQDIIIDPGFGFGKNLEHNYTLLKKLKEFKIFGCPILCGISRKSMVNKVLGTKVQDALEGTIVLNTIALMNGGNILRVHDVKEAKQVIQLVDFYRQ